MTIDNWKTKSQILSEEGISLSLYKMRLNELKLSPQYSALTKTDKIQNNPLSARKTTKRLVHHSVVKLFFSRRRLTFSKKDKTKKWALSKKWDYRVHIMPPNIFEDELIQKVLFFEERLKASYGRHSRVFFCVEDNPDGRGWVHTHLLVKCPKISIKTLKEEVELVFTYNYEWRVRVDKYDSEKWGESGVKYLLKDKKERYFRTSDLKKEDTQLKKVVDFKKSEST
jgi:hypothetical protein